MGMCVLFIQKGQRDRDPMAWREQIQHELPELTLTISDSVSDKERKIS